MDERKFRIKATKIAKRPKKTQRDLDRGDKSAEDRVKHHEEQQLIHELKNK